MVLQVSLSSSSLAVRLTGTSVGGGAPVGAWVTAGVVSPAVGHGGAGLLATGAAGCESALGLNPGWLVSAVGGGWGGFWVGGVGTKLWWVGGWQLLGHALGQLCWQESDA